MSLNRQQDTVLSAKQARKRSAVSKADKMKTRLKMSFPLVVIMSIIPTSLGEKGVYRLRNHVMDPSRREAQVAEPLSFSGDLTPILDAAQDLADAEAAASQVPVSSPTPPPVDIGCSGTNSEPTSIQYSYEMEISTASAQEETTILADLEQALNDALASELLHCPNLGYFSGGEDTGIVEFNPLPDDIVDTQNSCDPAHVENTTNTCRVMNGVMQVHYRSESDREIIEHMVLTGTQQFLESPGTIPGLLRTRYLGPAITDPGGATDGDGSGPDTPVTTDTGLSSRSIIFMSLASVGFVAAVSFVMYLRLRKSAREDEVPYVATLENYSSGEESPSRMDSSCEDSNFSSILPSNYKMDVSESPFDNSAGGSFSSPSFGMSSMGTIHETDDGPSDGQSDIVVSDGYTTEGDSSIEFPYFQSNYVANAAPVLGARPRTVSVSK